MPTHRLINFGGDQERCTCCRRVWDRDDLPLESEVCDAAEAALKAKPTITERPKRRRGVKPHLKRDLSRPVSYA